MSDTAEKMKSEYERVEYMSPTPKQIHEMTAILHNMAFTFERGRWARVHAAVVSDDAMEEIHALLEDMKVKS